MPPAQPFVPFLETVLFDEFGPKWSNTEFDSAFIRWRGEICRPRTLMERIIEPEITPFLKLWNLGDREALDRLMPMVMSELRRLARRQLIRERHGHALQTGDLINELYLRLIGQKRADWKNRTQFFAIATQIMRRIAVDHARSQRSAKRGGGFRAISLDETIDVPSLWYYDAIIALDDALDVLARIDPRQSRVVELRFFGGLSKTEIAKVLGVGVSTVGRDWALARSWLKRELRRG